MRTRVIAGSHPVAEAILTDRFRDLITICPLTVVIAGAFRRDVYFFGRDLMGIENVLFKSEEKKTTADAAGFLRLLADKLEAGRVALQQGDSEVVLDVPGDVTLEVKAESEEKRSGLLKSLEVEIEWYEGQGAEPKGPVTLG